MRVFLPGLAALFAVAACSTPGPQFSGQSLASDQLRRDTVAMLDGLAPGQIHPQPVKGSNGWGIYRLDSRAAVVPRSFERYRDELLGGHFEPECPWQPPVGVGTTPATTR